jgi:phosphoketolase
VAQCIVHVLEPVEVKEKQGKFRTLVRRTFDRMAKPVLEQASIWQTGQAVVVGKVHVLGAQAFALHDVREHRHETEHFAMLVVNRLDRYPVGRDRAVRPQ